MKPSVALKLKRAAVREATSHFRAAKPRIFGSVLHGTDQDGSDLDLLVDALPGATTFDLGGLKVELEEILGVSVDLLTPVDLPPSFRNQVLMGGGSGMNSSQLSDYLKHIRLAALDTYSFIEGRSKDDFLADKRTQSAVIMSLIVIGEAATKAMDYYADFAVQHAEVPWRSMRGMRNRIAHGFRYRMGYRKNSITGATGMLACYL